MITRNFRAFRNFKSGIQLRRVLIGAFAADRRLALAEYHLAVDRHGVDVLSRGNFEHHIEHHFFENRPQGAGTGAPLDGLFGECLQGVSGDAQLHAVHRELFAVLVDQSVFWLG